MISHGITYPDSLDSKGINDAIKSIGNGDGAVKLLPEVYKIDTPILISKNFVTLCGTTPGREAGYSGHGTTLKLVSGPDVIKLGQDNNDVVIGATLRDMDIDAQGGVGILATEKTNRCLFENTHIQNASTAWHIPHKCWGLTWNNCRASNWTRFGVDLRGASGNSVFNNFKVRTNGSSPGISAFRIGVDAPAYCVSFYGCNFEPKQNQYVFDIRRGGAFSFNGCYFEAEDNSCRDTFRLGYKGEIDGFMFTGNHVQGGGYHSSAFKMDHHPMNAMVIQGNTFRNYKVSVINRNSHTAHNDCTYANNHLKNVPAVFDGKIIGWE